MVSRSSRCRADGEEDRYHARDDGGGEVGGEVDQYRAGPVLLGPERFWPIAWRRREAGEARAQPGPRCPSPRCGPSAGSAGPPGSRTRTGEGRPSGYSGCGGAASAGFRDRAAGPSESCGAPHFRRSAVETGRRTDQSSVRVEGDAVGGIGPRESGKQEIARAAQQQQHGIEQHQPPERRAAAGRQGRYGRGTEAGD